MRAEAAAHATVLFSDFHGGTEESKENLSRDRIIVVEIPTENLPNGNRELYR
jgi:hypothetical protein